MSEHITENAAFSSAGRTTSYADVCARQARRVRLSRLRRGLTALGFIIVSIGVPAIGGAQSRGRLGAPPVKPLPTPPAAQPAPKPGALPGAQSGTQSATKQGPLARIIGTVFDSVAMQPLAGALVQLVAGDDPSRIRSVSSDARGAFAIDSVRVGSYVLGFFHVRLDSLGMETPLLRVDVGTDGEIRALIGIPSTRTLIARRCGTAPSGETMGLFMGFVRSARGEALPTLARVRAQWSELALGSRTLERRSRSQYATSSANGAFAICGIPTDGHITARAFSGPDSSGFVDFEAPRSGLLVRDMFVGAAQRVAVVSRADSGGGDRAAAGSVSTSVLRGKGMLRGVVRSATGTPVRGARVVLWGSGAETTTNSSGQFALQSLPGGTYTIEARAIGYLPRRTAVDVPEGVEGVADVAMDVFVPTVDTVRVRANRNAGMDPLGDFEKRRKGGFGYFMDEDAITKRNAMFMSDLIRGTPGITVSPGQLSGDLVTMRGVSGSGTCIPAIFVNGMRIMSDDGNLESVVNPQEIRGMEVYTRTGSMPIQFQALNGCGSIVVWTGARRKPSPND